MMVIGSKELYISLLAVNSTRFLERTDRESSFASIVKRRPEEGVMTRFCLGLRAERLVRLLTQRCSPALPKVATVWESAVQSNLRSNFLIAAAGQRLHSHASEGLRPQGPLPGILKSRATGKAGLSKDESGPREGPLTDTNTEETDDVATTEGAEGPRDLAQQIKKNNQANTASIKEAAKKACDEFKEGF